MTKRHFEALAAALKESKPSEPHPKDSEPVWTQFHDLMGQWRQDVRAVASVLKAHNPHVAWPLMFVTRFYDACGYEYEGKP